LVNAAAVGGRSGQESARLLALILAYPRQRTAERASSSCRDPMLIGVNCNLD